MGPPAAAAATQRPGGSSHRRRRDANRKRRLWPMRALLVRSRAGPSRKRPARPLPGLERLGSHGGWSATRSGGAESPGTRKSFSFPASGGGSVCSGRGGAARLGKLPGLYGYSSHALGGTETEGLLGVVCGGFGPKSETSCPKQQRLPFITSRRHYHLCPTTSRKRM